MSKRNRKIVTGLSVGLGMFAIIAIWSEIYWATHPEEYAKFQRKLAREDSIEAVQDSIQAAQDSIQAAKPTYEERLAEMPWDSLATRDKEKFMNEVIEMDRSSGWPLLMHNIQREVYNHPETIEIHARASDIVSVEGGTFRVQREITAKNAFGVPGRYRLTVYFKIRPGQDPKIADASNEEI